MDTPDIDPASELSVALDSREIRDLAYLVETTRELVRTQAGKPGPRHVTFELGQATYRAEGPDYFLVDGPADAPPVPDHIPENVIEENIDVVHDRALRGGLFDTFGTLDLPTDKSGIARLALRLLARTLRDIETNATIAADAVDPKAIAEQRQLAAEADADLDEAMARIDSEERERGEHDSTTIGLGPTIGGPYTIPDAPAQPPQLAEAILQYMDTMRTTAEPFRYTSQTIGRAAAELMLRNTVFTGPTATKQTSIDIRPDFPDLVSAALQADIREFPNLVRILENSDLPAFIKRDPDRLQELFALWAARSTMNDVGTLIYEVSKSAFREARNDITDGTSRGDDDNPNRQ